MVGTVSDARPGALRVGVLISGRGSNLEALIEAAARPGFPAQIVSVISNRPGALGLARAAQAGIQAQVIDHTEFADRQSFEDALTAHFENLGVELVCNAGFMRILTATFTEHWRDRHLNIHPSLLPAFRGLDTHAQVLAAGVRVTGCTVHVVREEMDAGPIVAQAAVAVVPGDTEQSLADRVLKAEHKLYPWALELVASGHARVEGERVVFSGPAGAKEPPLFSPSLESSFDGIKTGL